MDNNLTITTSLPLPEVVYRQMRAAILNGVFQPGQSLLQQEVAERLGVSRSPLREALPRLASEGLVVYHTRRGYAVVSLDPDEIMEVFDLRIMLESELIRRAVRVRTEADVDRLRTLLKQSAPLAKKSQTDRLDAWFELNTAFHSALLSAAKCNHILRAWMNTRALVESYIRMEVNLTGDLQQAQREHQEMFDAFVEGDEALLLDLTATHSRHTCDRLIAGLSARPPESSI